MQEFSRVGPNEILQFAPFVLRQVLNGGHVYPIGTRISGRSILEQDLIKDKRKVTGSKLRAQLLRTPFLRSPLLPHPSPKLTVHTLRPGILVSMV